MSSDLPHYADKGCSEDDYQLSWSSKALTHVFHMKASLEFCRITQILKVQPTVKNLNGYKLSRNSRACLLERCASAVGGLLSTSIQVCAEVLCRMEAFNQNCMQSCLRLKYVCPIIQCVCRSCKRSWATFARAILGSACSVVVGSRSSVWTNQPGIYPILRRVLQHTLSCVLPWLPRYS